MKNKRITHAAALLVIEGLGLALLLAIVWLGAKRGPSPAPQLQPPQLSLPAPPVLRANQAPSSFAGS